jgi:hypothetical protein
MALRVTVAADGTMSRQDTCGSVNPTQGTAIRDEVSHSNASSTTGSSKWLLKPRFNTRYGVAVEVAAVVVAIHSDAWAGSTARRTVSSKSAVVSSSVTDSRRCAANAATIRSAS